MKNKQESKKPNWRNEDVVSFRLSGRTEDEQYARQILNQYRNMDWNIPEIMVAALCCLGGYPLENPNAVSKELKTIQDNTAAILELLSSGVLVAKGATGNSPEAIDPSRMQALIESATAMVQKGAGRRVKNLSDED